MLHLYIHIHTYVHIILEPTFNNTIIKGAIIGKFFPAAAGIASTTYYIHIRRNSPPHNLFVLPFVVFSFRHIVHNI